MTQSKEEFSRLDGAEAKGKRQASDLLPLVYDELKRLARQKLAKERADHTLQPTALVHEAYLRLAGNKQVQWANRTQFLFAAATAMRRILIDHARKRGQLKRGGTLKKLSLDEVDLASQKDLSSILALDEALARLEESTPSVAAVVQLRFYCGLTVEETAEALGISPRTVKREWTYARARLFKELNSDSA